ncbi:MAG: AbrB/MazE/SpoVT family DNA-binding domain-containing protein [Luteitalea sp.]|nr:AbrB/MazE/SpoVT family DNA-binding domain-containing protein [Luteitalea sp.]
MDKAGRLVIPAHIRERTGLVPGSEVDIQVDDLGIRLVRTAPRPKLVRRGKANRLVARPTATTASRPTVDVGELIEEERNRWPW